MRYAVAVIFFKNKGSENPIRNRQVYANGEGSELNASDRNSIGVCSIPVLNSK